VLKDKVPRAELLTLAYKAQVLCELTLSDLCLHIAVGEESLVILLQCEACCAQHIITCCINIALQRSLQWSAALMNEISMLLMMINVAIHQSAAHCSDC
jgi:hypothetical protein